MRRITFILVLISLIAALWVTSCVHKPQVQVVATYGGFPDSVGKIFLAKCTNSGCHNAASYMNAAELQLDTWEHLFNGGISGAAVVAYSPKYSPLLYYINAYDSSDLIAYDRTHFKTPLTQNEYVTIKNWISSGAPDQNGNIPFASDPTTRQKLYLTNQGCDLVAVIDGKSKLVMRYIPIGMDPGHSEAPHFVAISADGRYGYIPLFSGNYLQKFDTYTDTIITSLDLSGYAANPGSQGNGGWSLLSLSPLDTAILVSGYAPFGYAVCVNTAAMKVNTRLSITNASGASSIFPFLHGIASNATFDTFYATLQYGNAVVKYHFKPNFDTQNISVNGLPVGTLGDSSNHGTPNPHQILMSPDHSRYFVTCQQTGVVSVIDAHTDTLIKQIPVGAYPQEMDFSKSKGYLFVCCMGDATNPPPHLGSVYVINYHTLDVVTVLRGDFYEPHDVAVDEQDGLVYIPSRNTDANGIPSHHATSCGGNAGWYSVYNLNTLEPADHKRYEVTKDPYAISARFK